MVVIPASNARELRERIDFRDISVDIPDQVPARVRDCIANVIDRAVSGSQPGKCCFEMPFPGF